MSIRPTKKVNKLGWALGIAGGVLALVAAVGFGAEIGAKHPSDIHTTAVVQQV